MKWKRILTILLLALIVLQFIRPERNLSPGEAPAGISRVFPETASVEPILKKACYDCHSNNTRYPWYSNLQPLGWWLQHHVDEGKGELNFDEFARYDRSKQDHKLEETIEVLEKDEMPLSSYVTQHADAQLSAAEKKALIGWAGSLRRKLADTTLPDTR